jgi:hypothetical protein
MKHFFKKIAIFVLLVLFVILGICEIEIPDAYVIRMTQNTSYEKIAWNLQLINSNPKKITNSAIFIGPSWLQGGVNDSLLNSCGYKSINMGVNHSGADLDFYLVSRIIKYKPKYIFLHRFPNGQGVFHPMMPLLMSPLKYFSNFKNTSSDFLFKFIPKRLYFVLKYIGTHVSRKGQTRLLEIENKKSQFGWRPGGFSRINLNRNELKKLVDDKIILNCRINAEIFDENGVLVVKGISLINIWREVVSIFFSGNGETVRSKTISLCDKANVKVAEIYIPCFQDACYDTKFDSNRYFFRKRGVSNRCYYLKDVSFLSNQDCWYDVDHLNTKGACLFTDSLIKILPIPFFVK